MVYNEYCFNLCLTKCSALSTIISFCLAMIPVWWIFLLMNVLIPNEGSLKKWCIIRHVFLNYTGGAGSSLVKLFGILFFPY